MERVVEQLHVRGPVLLRELVEPADVGGEVTVRDPGKERRKLDRIVQSALGHIGLADQGQRRLGPALEASLHRRQRHGLIFGHETALRVPRWKRHKHGRDESDDHAHAQRDPSHRGVLTSQRPVGPHGRHREGRRYHGAHLVVQVLRDRPQVEHERSQIGDLIGPVRGDRVAHRVLHEGVRRDDEVARKPAADKQRDGGQVVELGAQLPLTPE